MIASQVLDQLNNNTPHAREYSNKPMALYQRTRYHTDDEYKAKFIEACRVGRQRMKENNYERYCEINRESSKRHYQNNPEYQQKQKERALARYYRLKQEKLASMCSSQKLISPPPTLEMVTT